MKLLLRLIRYLAPSKGQIALVIVVSIATSLLGVVSIYSVLPLLNAVFTADKTVRISPSVPKPPDNTVVRDARQQASPSLTSFDAEALKASVTRSFEQLFQAETRQKTLFNICLFLIAAFALKNFFVYLNGQLIFRIQTRTAKKLRDDVFRSIIEMHLDYFNKNRVGNLMNLVYNDVRSEERR